MSGPTFLEVQTVLFGFTEQCFSGGRPETEASEADRVWLADHLNATAMLLVDDVAQWPLSRQMALFTLLQFSVMILEDMARRGAMFAFAPEELARCGNGCLAQPLLSTLATFQSIILG